MLEFMEKNNVKSYLEARCTEITPEGIKVEINGKEEFINADSVVICAGTKAKAGEREAFRDVAFDVINVGDCVKASDVVNAVRTGWDAGATI